MNALTVRVRSRYRLTPSTVMLELESATTAPLPSFDPGAHVDLVLPSGPTRPYWLLPASRGASTWRIAVCHPVTSRAAHPFLETAPLSTVLTALGPQQRFPFVPADHYTFLAGGIGIAPLLGMIQAAERADRPWQLFYTGRSTSEMPFLPELRRRYARRLHVYAQDQGQRLDVAEVLGRALRDGVVYCCGPESMAHEADSLAPPGVVRAQGYRCHEDLTVAPGEV